jgi:hypothetical protein
VFPFSNGELVVFISFSWPVVIICLLRTRHVFRDSHKFICYGFEPNGSCADKVTIESAHEVCASSW